MGVGAKVVEPDSKFQVDSSVVQVDVDQVKLVLVEVTTNMKESSR